MTGASGFIGRHAARRLADEGWSVSAIGHSQWRDEEWHAWGIDRWMTATVTLGSIRELADACGDPDLIVHCAGSGSVGFSIKRPKEDFDRTVGSTSAILEFARERSPGVRVIYPSSAAVYGQTGRLPIHEDLPPTPLSPYGVHKHMAERLCELHAREWEVPVAIVRFFSVYGAGLCKQLLWDACRKASRDEFSFFGTGQERRDWMHVNDAARLLRLASEHASHACPIVNGGVDIGRTTREVLERLGSMWPEAKHPTFIGESRSGDPSDLVADVSRLSEWGFEPRVGFEEGIDEYVRWFRAEHAT